VRILQISDRSHQLAEVRHLWRSNSATLGFFPDGAFEEYARRGHILVALAPDGTCVGYLLYRVTRGHVIIAHLCVREHYRKQGIARLLFDDLRARTSRCCGVRVLCRDDFPASAVWPALGFYPVADRRGRSQEGHALTAWWFDYGHPTLFSYVLEPRSVAILDANVVFDMQDESGPSHEESAALLATWLQQWVVLCVTDEVYHEIRRQKSESERKRRRAYASSFPIMNCEPSTWGTVLNDLRPCHRHGLS
jgi:ribosomal protein S18 acetylase RimI-like enzyme